MHDIIRPYSRIDINKEFIKVKKKLHDEAVIRGVELDGRPVSYFEDVYTGSIFRGGEKYEYEHIRSAENLHSEYKNIHTDKEIALIVNHRNNIGVTSLEINRFKDKYRIEDRILNDDDLIRKFQIDVFLTKRNVSKADTSINEMSLQILRDRRND
ncbi:hypothetical protein [Gillisia sp. Hel_I_29]|uniref:hypothetical protein n=1 Tax=Gillisia sp. Hel_I_29 TaxID=1249975 RepID=UPI00068FD15C|nr:hypothetical protein [Gillisia sp. Hel_I_29]